MTLAFTCLPANILTHNPVINQNEYNQLLQQCLTIANIIRQNNDFDRIEKNAHASHQKTVDCLAERFGGSAQVRSQLDASHQLQSSLNILRAEHEQRVNALILNAIAFHLRSIGSPTALLLLANILSGKAGV